YGVRGLPHYFAACGQDCEQDGARTQIPSEDDRIPRLQHERLLAELDRRHASPGPGITTRAALLGWRICIATASERTNRCGRAGTPPLRRRSGQSNKGGVADGD